MEILYHHGMDNVQLETILRLKKNMDDILLKSPSNRDALTKLIMLLYGFVTKPLAESRNTEKNPRCALTTHVKLVSSIVPPNKGFGLDEVLLLMKRGLDAGLQDNRIFRAYGLAAWQKCLSGEAFSIANKDYKDPIDPKDCLKISYQYLGRVSTLIENSANPFFLVTFARVCEANGEINRALTVLGKMVSDFDTWEYLPHAILYASNLCYHPCFKSEHLKRGLQYIEYVTHEMMDKYFKKKALEEINTTNNETKEIKKKENNNTFLGWEQWELYFTVARAYQISGRGDLAAPRFRVALQIKKKLATPTMITDTMLIHWLQDSNTWQYMGTLYIGAGLNLFAADSLAQSIHLEKVHSVGHWLPLADALRRAGAYGESVMASAHAYEIDRCHDSVRRRLHSWSPEWRSMFQVESKVVTLIQAVMRRYLAGLKMIEVRKLHAIKIFNVKTIQYWYKYYKGLKDRRAKRMGSKLILVKINKRLCKKVFRLFSRVVERNRNARSLRKRILLRLTKNVYDGWAMYAKISAEQRKLYLEAQAQQERKVNRVLQKILRRMETKVFYQWTLYANRSIKIKNMMRRILLERKRFLKDRWYTNVIDAIEERRMKIEPTIFIRDDDLTRRLHHASLLGGPRLNKISKQLQPYIIGPGGSWKRSNSRLTKMRTCFYRARKIGETIQIPNGVPISEEELKECMSFKSFVSTSAPMTSSDGRTIAEYLIGNQFTRSLLLYNGQLQDKGVMAIAATIEFSSPEIQNSVLQTLGIGNHNVGVRGALALSKALKAKHCALTCLYLENNPKIGDVGIEMIANALEKNVRLEKLVLSSNNINDKGCVSLANSMIKNSSLRHLTLNHNNIGCSGFNALISVMSNGRNTTLSHLIISNNTKISNTGASHLAKCIGSSMSHIIELDVSSCDINDSGILAIEKSLTKLYTDNHGNREDETASDTNDRRVGGGTIEMLFLQRLSLCDNFIHGSAAKKLSDSIGKVTNGCVIEFEGNPIDPISKGSLVYDSFSKRIGSPRKASPRKGGASEYMFQSSQELKLHLVEPEAPSRTINNKFLPSRAALESLGKVGLQKIQYENETKSSPKGREEEEGEESMPSFSPAGFSLKALPPVKPGLLPRINRKKKEIDFKFMRN
jgi:hypothetical protein